MNKLSPLVLVLSGVLLTGIGPCASFPIPTSPGGVASAVHSGANAAQEIAAKQKQCEVLKNPKIAYDEERVVGGVVALRWIQGGGGVMIDPAEASLAAIRADQAKAKATKNEKAELNAWLNKLGKQVAGYSARPSLEWTFGVLNSDVLNGFSSPGGYVMVTKGLLRKIDNEAQLVGVLGHEIGHVTNRDALKVYAETKYGQCFSAYATGKATRVASDAAGATTGVDFDTVLAASGGHVNLNKMTGEAIQKFLDSCVDNIVSKGYAKDDEYAADRVAVELMISAGYNPREYVNFMDKIPDGGGVFANHPSNKDRKESLEKYLASLKPAGDEFSPFADYPFDKYAVVPLKKELAAATK